MSQMSRQNRRKSKRNITFPVTVRQAQKLIRNPSIRIGWEMMKAVGLSSSAFALSPRDELRKRLDQMAQINPDALIEPVASIESVEDEGPEDYEDYEDYEGPEDYDYDYEDYEEIREEEKWESGVDSPSVEAQEAVEAVENRKTGESRPKDTDEVFPLSDNPSEESDLHGGDGNSGECDAPAQTNSQAQDAQPHTPDTPESGSDEQERGSGDPSGLPGEGSDRGADENEGRSETGGNSTSEDDRSSGQSRSSDRHPGHAPSTALGDSVRPDGNMAKTEMSDQPRDAGTQESGDSQTFDASDASDASDTPEQFGGDRAEEDVPLERNLEGNQPGDDRPAHQKKWGKKFGKAEKEKAQLSASANDKHGGVTAELKEKLGVDAKLLKLCRQRLAALVGDSSQDYQDYSPRRDYAEFCVRLKTYRNPSPARKEELGRPVILVMADVSGSCSSFSEQSIAVAKAASSLGVPSADVLVLAHSNGCPEELEHNGKAVSIEAIAPPENEAWYDALTQRFQIQVVIALGDWDAVHKYLYLAAHPVVERLIWLDNAHCSSRGTVEDRTNWAIQRIGRIGIENASRIRHKLVYRDGCKDAIAFINNINATGKARS